MGSNELRKIYNSQSKWTDKTAKKHKHSFSVPAIAEVEQPNLKYYFDVMKCQHCNSFVGVSRQGAFNGFIGKIEDLSDEQKMRPFIRLEKDHKTIGYKDAKLK